MAERSAGIVLAGGRSTRMGSPKATLEWHGTTLVRRAAGLVARAVEGPVVVVHAAGQALAPLPAEIELAEDERSDRGPLEGIAAGLRRIGERADVVFVTGVDAPHLHPAFVAHVVRCLGPGDDVALPRAGGFDHPLAAAYRIAALAPALAGQLANERLRTGALVGHLRSRTLEEAALLADPAVAVLDPQLDSLANLNAPSDYEAARAKPAPHVTVRPFPGAAARAVRGATLAQATAAAGVAPGTGAVLDGHGPISDPDEPLATGDALTFASQAARS